MNTYQKISGTKKNNTMIDDEDNAKRNREMEAENRNHEEELDKQLEMRMYFFVPYNISEIAKGIQAGHAALRYARAFSADNLEVWDFVDNHETWIILNGGTMNDTRDFDGIAAGSMNQIADDLLANDIMFSHFLEPDLNNGLSALCFLCDEQVFNFEDYPDFINHLADTRSDDDQFKIELIVMGEEEVIEAYPDAHKEWVRFMGGVKNVFLRNLIRDKKLA